MEGAYRFCAHKSYLIYNIGLSERGNPRTNFGTATHKAFELLAQRKLAEQKNETFIENDIFAEKFPISDITIESAFDMAWDFCSKSMDYHEWPVEDKKKFYKLYTKALNFRNGQYNPLKLNVIAPELFFDFELEEPWAKYDYMIDGEKVSGYLRIRGTIDFITRDEDGFIRFADYKSGKMVDWNVGEWHKPKPKAYDDFPDDFQLLLYYFVMRRFYPNEDILGTIYYLQDGPYDIHFDEYSYGKALKRIKEFVEKFRSIQVPQLTKHLGNTAENFYNKKKCSWCDFNKQSDKYHPQKTICEYFKDEIVNLGIDKVTEKHIIKERVLNYTSGGGRGFDNK